MINTFPGLIVHLIKRGAEATHAGETGMFIGFSQRRPMICGRI